MTVFRKGKRLCATYSGGCSVIVEVEGSVTIGGAKLLAKWARRGLAKVKRERDAFLFTNGKSLSLSSVSILSKPCREGYLALFWKGVFLGVGKLEKSKVANVLDTGDFLRRGY